MPAGHVLLLLLDAEEVRRRWVPRATFRQPVLSLACGRFWPRRQLPLRRGDELESVARKVRRARKLSGSAPDGRSSARRRNPRSAARCRPDTDLESVLR